MAEEKRGSAISPEEDLLIGETPAVLANKFYATSNPYGTKITFAEGFLAAGEQQFRSRYAVYLVPNDIRDLFHLLEPIVEAMRKIQVNDPNSSTDG